LANYRASKTETNRQGTIYFLLKLQGGLMKKFSLIAIVGAMSLASFAHADETLYADNNHCKSGTPQAVYEISFDNENMKSEQANFAVRIWDSIKVKLVGYHCTMNGQN
jgi:hypothetical protein